MFLVGGLKKTGRVIKKHKGLFILLFLTQLIFLVVFATVQVKYQVAILQNFKEVVEPLEQASYNAALLQAGMPLIGETAQIMESWNKLKASFQYLLIFSFLGFAVLNGFNWSLTHYLIRKQNLLKVWGKFIVLSAVFFIPYLVIIFGIFESVLFENNPYLAAQIMVGIAVVFFYFALIGFSFADLSLKKVWKKVFWEVGIKKFYWVLLVYLIIFLILGLLVYLLYLAVNYWAMFWVVLFMVLIVLMVNVGRVFLISSLSEIN